MGLLVELGVLHRRACARQQTGPLHLSLFPPLCFGLAAAPVCSLLTSGRAGQAWDLVVVGAGVAGCALAFSQGQVRGTRGAAAPGPSCGAWGARDVPPLCRAYVVASLL